MPTPRVNRPCVITAEVAAAWAITAGWMRTVGQVTAVVTGSEQTWEIGSDHGPDERALALLVVPGVEVVADPQRLEAGRFCGGGLGHQVGRAVLLAGQEVSDLHGCRVPEKRGVHAAEHQG